MNLKSVKPAIKLVLLMVTAITGFSQHSQDTTSFNKLVALDKIIVIGKSSIRQLNEQPVSAIVIDLRSYHTQSADLTQILNRLPGVRIRTQGSAGAPVSINLNGLQGKAVRLFRDGIPADYLGRAFNPGLLSPNSFLQVEVYKGVVPVMLGADALGGAVNFVRQLPAANHLASGYELGSYGSHKATASFARADTVSGFFSSLDGYLTDALNNYKVVVQVADAQTAQLRTVQARRFHDRQRSGYAEWSAGLKNKKWADVLYFSLACSYMNNQLQHAALMSIPYKYAFATERGIIPSLRYKKTFKRVYADGFVSYSGTANKLTDTSSVRYNWLQETVSSHNSGGELSTAYKSLLQLKWRNALVRLNTAWQINDHHKLDANYSVIDQSRSGQDPVGARSLGGVDPFNAGARYSRMIGGVSWTNTSLAEGWENVTGLKYFAYRASGFDILTHHIYKDKVTQTSGRSFGWFEAIKYRVNSKWFVRGSYEWSGRLPDQAELLGDGLFIRSNFSLRPERSHNINAGINFQLPGLLTAELSTFFRHARNLVFLQPGIPFSTYINLDQTRITGGEMAVSWNISRLFQAGGNVTYQDARRVNITLPAEKYLENARIPNMPYLFYNLYGRFQKTVGRALLHAYYYLNHVQAFDLYFNPAASNEFVIPAQHIHSVAQSVTFPAAGITLGAEVKNIFDARVYDYYRVQRPGRTFHIKLNYHLSFK